MRKKRLEEKLEQLTWMVQSLAAEISNKNGTITQLNDIIKNQRIHLDRTMDRLMSRNFQELATFTPLDQPNKDFVLPDMEDMLIGTVGEPSSNESGNLNEH